MRRTVAGAALVSVLAVAPSAWAGGLYFSERGVRPLGRGGAFVAGADDLGAIWYNPAGLHDAKNEFLFDAAWLNFTTEVQRRARLEQRDPNTGQVVGTFEQTFPEVQGRTPVVPIPTIAGSYSIDEQWTIAGGVTAPYAAITTFPESVNGQPAAQRYSIITLEGSALAIVGVYASYAPVPEFRIGAGLQALVGKFVSTTMFSGCLPDRFFCAPEQPEWDMLAQLDAGPIFAPSGNFGATWVPNAEWRVGLGFQAPFAIRAPANLAVRLPATPVFETARTEGSDADIAFELPWSLRLGVQFQPIDPLRVELAGAVEGWSMHDEITIEPTDVALRNVVGFPDPYRVPTQTLPRNFRETGSVRLGGEYDFSFADIDWSARMGVSYESSAVPPAYLSALTIDMDKFTLGVGLSLAVGAARFDVVYAHVFGVDVDVSTDVAAMPILTPVQGNAGTPQHIINAGLYSARADVLGLGFRYDFDHVDDTDASAPAEAKEEKEEARVAPGAAGSGA